MLFGGSEKEARIDDLEALLNDSFDAKISSIDNRSSSLINSIEQAKNSFLSACDSFERSAKKPDMEMMWRATSEQHIADQKLQYIGALRRIIKSDTSAESKNLYSSYSSKLAQARTLLDEVLKINNKFRMVLEAYSNELNGFKNAFTTMERNVKELGARLDARAGELNEYTETMKEIEKLQAFSKEAEELQMIDKEMEQGGTDRDTAGADSPIDSLKRELADSRLQISTIDKAITDTKNNITARLAPLDKPARKYEHGMSKMHLSYYLDDPAGRLLGNEALSEFSKHVASLRKEINENRIQVKNLQDTYHAADFVLNGSISALLDEIRILNGKRDAIHEKVESLERSVREIERVEGAKQRKVMAAGELKSRIEKVHSARNSAKSNVESMFEKFYRKRVKVT